MAKLGKATPPTDGELSRRDRKLARAELRKKKEDRRAGREIERLKAELLDLQNDIDAKAARDSATTGATDKAISEPKEMQTVCRKTN